jgi:hypothetical protein
MILANRQYHFCRGIRCVNLQESYKVGIPRECTLEACQYANRHEGLADFKSRIKAKMKARNERRKGGAL